LPSACVIQVHLNGVVTQVETALVNVQWGKTFCARVLEEEAAALAQEVAAALEAVRMTGTVATSVRPMEAVR